MDSAPFNPDNFYRIVNEGDTTLQDTFDSIPYYIEPGHDAVVPFGAVCLWFGDPNAVDTERNRWRHQEADRLRTKYGAYDSDERWEENKPRFKVVTMKGDPVHTVIDDPTGTRISPAAQKQIEVENMNARMEQMETELLALRSQKESRDHVERSQEDNQLAEDFEEVKEDEPNQPRIGSRFTNR